MTEGYPLILNTVGRLDLNFIQNRGSGEMGMHARHPEPLVKIHPETAKELGLSEGDWV